MICSLEMNILLGMHSSTSLLLYAAAYLDNVIIHSDTWQHQLRRVVAVLEALRRAGLTANPNKCVIG